MDRFAEAEDAVRKAIRIGEELAERDPKHLENLAEYHTELYELFYTEALTSVGRHDEALASIEKALEIQRKITTPGNKKQLKALAYMLLLCAWIKMGDECSITTAEEAIQIYRSIGEEKKIPYGMHILGAVLMRNERFSEAIETYSEAVPAQRDLVRSEPGNLRYKKDLLSILNANAILNTEYIGDVRKGVESYNEALEIRRSLLDEDPKSSRKALVLLLHNNGCAYLKIHKLKEAEKHLAELFEVSNEKLDDLPEYYSRYIETGYYTMSLVESMRGNSNKAIDMIDRSIQMCRERIKGQTARWQLFLALELEVSSVVRMRAGEFEEAEVALEEAINIYRTSEIWQPRWQGNFAGTLNNYAIVLWRQGRIQEAKDAIEEALEIAQEKVENYPEPYYGLQSNSFNNLGIFLASTDKLKTAENHLQKSLSITEHLFQRTPEQYKYHLGLVLHNYSYLQRKMRRNEEAYTHLKRAIEIKRELIKEYPDVAVFRKSLETSLGNLVTMLYEDESSDAGDAIREYQEICGAEEGWSMAWEEKYITFEELP
ncbi:MAG: tetratricopeptide repeat protein [Candidatus Thorarchaeota archaeon]